MLKLLGDNLGSNRNDKYWQIVILPCIWQLFHNVRWIKQCSSVKVALSMPVILLKHCQDHRTIDTDPPPPMEYGIRHNGAFSASMLWFIESCFCAGSRSNWPNRQLPQWMPVSGALCPVPVFLCLRHLALRISCMRRCFCYANSWLVEFENWGGFDCLHDDAALS